jgi:SOS regulatory protein LexA
VSPVVWSLLMLLLLALSALGGERLGSMLADRRRKMARGGHESERLLREGAQDRPSGLVMTFVDGSPQIESSINPPDEDTVEKMLEDAQAYIDSVHREPGTKNESEWTGKGVATDENRETISKRHKVPAWNWDDVFAEPGDERSEPPSTMEPSNGNNLPETIGEKSDARTTGRVADARPRHPSEIPLIGTVAAGAPILAEENIEAHLPIAQELFGPGEYFGLRIRGSSMVDAGILDGDLVVVRPQAIADHGEIILALIGDEATVKRLKRLGEKVLLVSDNPQFDPIDAAEATILGKVVGVIRHVRSPQ